MPGNVRQTAYSDCISKDNLIKENPCCRFWNILKYFRLLCPLFYTGYVSYISVLIGKPMKWVCVLCVATHTDEITSLTSFPSALDFWNF